jgi:hypothetical protein
LNLIVKVQGNQVVVGAVDLWVTWSLRKVIHISISPIQETPELHTFTEKDLHYPQTPESRMRHTKLEKLSR